MSLSSVDATTSNPSATIDYTIPSHDRPIDFSVVHGAQRLNLYCNGKENAVDVVNFLRTKFQMWSAWNFSLHSGGEKIYVRPEEFQQQKQIYARTGDVQREDSLRYAADVNALLRITEERGSKAFLRVSIEG